MPDLRAFEWNIMRGDDWPPEVDPDSNTHIFFEMEANSQMLPGFGCSFTVYCTPKADSEQRALWLAKIFSISYEVTVLVAFTHPDKPHNPYYDLIFEQGQSFLVDDSKVEFGEPYSPPLQCLGPYPVEVAAFDSLGRRVGAL